MMPRDCDADCCRAPECTADSHPEDCAEHDLRDPEFDRLDSAYTLAQAKWNNHVDHCSVCDRSVFACQTGLDLSHSANAAWNAARRAWLGLTERQRAWHADLMRR